MRSLFLFAPASDPPVYFSDSNRIRYAELNKTVTLL
jgi:hypothetical protein